jgi:hypothetical protein
MAINESGKTAVGLSPTLEDLVGSEVFTQAVVIDVIYDPGAFFSQDEDYLKAKYPDINDAFLARAPRNAIIARILNQGAAKSGGRNILCLPFFPPHLCFPVKPGEHVWLTSAGGHGSAANILFWLCRVPSWDDTDDLNYTHDSRADNYGVVLPPDAADEAEGDNPKTDNVANELIFGYPNGQAKKEETFNIDGGPHAYTNIILESLAYKSFKPEPVPRLTKRPGDFVIQGSNNTSISLGTTRGFPGGFAEAADEMTRLDEGFAPPSAIIFDDGTGSTATLADPEEPDSKPALEDIAAAIDIVVGRGLRIRAAGGPDLPKADADPPLDAMTDGHAPTYPRIKLAVNPKDSLEKNPDDTPNKGEDRNVASDAQPEIVETSKNPQAYVDDVLDNVYDNCTEGDPDFRYDASRIYMTADSKPDTDFGLSDQMGEIGGVNLVEQNHEGASIVIKSDNIRIIARKDPDDAEKAFSNGSIRIIKEGKVPDAIGAESGDERAIISIEPNGTIYIDGPRIIIGNARLTEPVEPEGKGQHVFIGGEDATESMVLGEAFADVIIALAVDIVNMCGGSGTAESMTTDKVAAPTPGVTPSLGNMGAPLFNPASGPIIFANLRKNLTNALSRIAKTK